MAIRYYSKRFIVDNAVAAAKVDDFVAVDNQAYDQSTADANATMRLA